MTTTNEPKKRAILYARVSTDEQARSGYSLAQQIEVLKEFCAREGYEVLEEVTDPGQSGATLERPGLDRVRDLVTAGSVSVVLAQDRDRFAREPAYLYLLRQEFAEHGTGIRSLNDRGDDSPEGELTDGILDQLAKYERAKTAERSRRGKLRKAREGKLIANNNADFGFRYNENRDGYEVDEDTMLVVRHIFQRVADGHSLNSIAKMLDDEGVLPPGIHNKSGKWDRTYIRRHLIEDDTYKPHTFKELEDLVDEGLLAREVLNRLDPNCSYGLCWSNRHKVETIKKKGKRRHKTTERPREEWIAVPVPDSGVPRELVEAAREAVKDNQRWPSSSSDERFWELAGGIARCGACNRAMTHRSVLKRNGQGKYFYYYCRNACPNRKNLQAADLEGRVADFVSGLLTDAGKLTAKIDELIEHERRTLRDPEPEAKAWAVRLADVNRKRSGYLDLAADGLMSKDELRAKLTELEEEKTTAGKALADIDDRRRRIEELERDKDALLEFYRQKALTNGLAFLTPEQRHAMYRRMRLVVRVGPGGIPFVDAGPDSFTPGTYKVDFDRLVVRGSHGWSAEVEGVVPDEEWASVHSQSSFQDSSRFNSAS